MKRVYVSSYGPGVLFLLVLMISACAGKPKTNNSAASAVESAAGVSGGGSASRPVAFTNNPLVAQYSLKLREGEAAEIDFGPSTSYGLRTSTKQAPEGGGVVNFLVAGMRPATLYHMRGRIRQTDGSERLDSDHAFRTGPVPAAWFPSVTVTQPGGFVPSPGIEMVDLNGGTPGQLHAVAFDLQGNLIWYYDFGSEELNDVPFPMKLLPNGNMVMVVAGPDNSYREIDLAGNIVRNDTEASLDQKLAAGGFSLIATGFEHDILPLPNGHIILLAYQQRYFTDLPGYPGQLLVGADCLIDVDPDGNPVWTWSAFDHLDVNRHPFGLPDWTHANGLAYSPDDGNLLLSLRNQSWVIKIDYRDGHGLGDVLWRLGPGGDFSLASGGPDAWNYAQHAPVIVSPAGAGLFSLAMFDNGNNRPTDPAGDPCSPTTVPACYSRPVIFQIDETAKSAAIQWQDNLPAYSYCCGNAEPLPNGDMEFDIAATVNPPQFSTVQEVTYENDPQLVWQMIVRGQLAYRATRLPSLYPGVQW